MPDKASRTDEKSWKGAKIGKKYETMEAVEAMEKKNPKLSLGIVMIYAPNAWVAMDYFGRSQIVEGNFLGGQ